MNRSHKQSCNWPQWKRIEHWIGATDCLNVCTGRWDCDDVAIERINSEDKSAAVDCELIQSNIPSGYNNVHTRHLSGRQTTLHDSVCGDWRVEILTIDTEWLRCPRRCQWYVGHDHSTAVPVNNDRRAILCGNRIHIAVWRSTVMYVGIHDAPHVSTCVWYPVLFILTMRALYGSVT